MFLHSGTFMIVVLHWNATEMVTRVLLRPRFCAKDSRARSIVLGIGPALLLTLWQNLIMPNMIFRSAMVWNTLPNCFNCCVHLRLAIERLLHACLTFV